MPDWLPSTPVVQHYDTHHYIPEKRDALMRWFGRFKKVIGYDPNDVMKTKRNGYQGKGAARRVGTNETYRQRKARLAAAGRDLGAERRRLRLERIAGQRRSPRTRSDHPDGRPPRSRALVASRPSDPPAEVAEAP